MSKSGSVRLRRPDGTVQWEDFAHVDPQEGYVFCKDASGERHFFPWHKVEEVKRAPEADRLLQVNEEIRDAQDIGMFGSSTLGGRIAELVGDPNDAGEFPSSVRIEGTLRITEE